MNDIIILTVWDIFYCLDIGFLNDDNYGRFDCGRILNFTYKSDEFLRIKIKNNRKLNLDPSRLYYIFNKTNYTFCIL